MSTHSSYKKLAIGLITALTATLFHALPAAAAPSVPTNVSVVSTSEPNTAIGSASARVEWAASTGAVGYSALATAGDENVFSSTPVCQNGNCVAFFSGLTGGQTYGVRVSAVAADGSSASTNPLNHTAVSVPATPTSLTATAGNGAARLQWNEPGSLGGLALTGYVLIDQENRETSLASTATSITVSNLINGTSYVFRITAVNQNGRSAEARFSAVTPVGPPLTPTRPSVSTTSNTLTATWAAPGDGGSSITGYKAVLFKDGTREVEQDLLSGVRTATFTNLSPSNYTVRIQAINAIGASELSLASLTTPVGSVLQAQTIDFPAIASQVPPGVLNLVATASSGLTVTFTATGACTLEAASSVLTYQSAGTCTVIASQAGNNAFAAANAVTRSFAIALPSQEPSVPISGGGGGGGRAPSSGGGGAGTADIFISSSPTVSYLINGVVELTVTGSALSPVYRVTLGGVTASFVARSDTTLVLRFLSPATGSSQLTLFFGDRAKSIPIMIELGTAGGSEVASTSSPVIQPPTSSPEPPVVISPVKPKVSTATVGSFKGFLAIYLSQLEGKRVSIRVAGKWLTVRSVPSNFHRVTRKVGAGFRIAVQVFVGGKPLRTITVTTR